MNCPVCHDTRMKEVEKNGVLIDICPSCKGVWLDRGELDKLMQEVREVRDEYNHWYYDDRHDPSYPRPPHPQQGYPQQPYPPQSHPQHGYDPKYHGYGGHYKHKKKKSVLDLFGDLFD
jgi:hypothetical protein